MLKMGIIGAGRYAENRILPAVQSAAVEVVAICRRNKVEAQRLAKKFSIKDQYQSIDSFLSNAEMNFVWVCSPNTLHFEHAQKAIDAGKAVVVEKPFTATSKEARKLQKLAKDKNVPLFVGCIGRVSPSIIELKKKVPEIGKLQRFEASLTYNLGAGVGDGSIDSSSYRKWFFDRDARAVGALYDQGSHLLDALIWLCGTNWRPISCHRTRHKSAEFCEIDVSAALTLSRSDGAIAQLYLNQGCAFDSQISLIGEKGGLSSHRPFAKGPMQMVRLASGDSQQQNFFASYDVQSDFISEIDRAVNGGKTVLATAEEGAQVIKLIEECIRLEEFR